jgi:acid stress-induced BolA-like protein IbaG/YrbA
VFEGLRPVKKQQLVYAALSDRIADGSIHAVNIRTFTPAEWQARASG